MNLCLVIVGRDYVEALHGGVKHLSKLKINKIYVLTNKKLRVSKILEDYDVEYFNYTEKYFSYFDKLYFLLEIIQKTNSSTVYVDVRRLKSLLYYDLINIEQGINTIGPWGDDTKTADKLINKKTECFEKGYFNDIVKSFDINPKKIKTVLEQLLVITPDINSKEIFDILKNKEELFIETSITKKSSYEYVGNGEGLALGYAAEITSTPVHKLKLLNYL